MNLFSFINSKTFEFTYEFFNCLKNKNITKLDKKELTQTLYYFYLNKEYDNIFKHLNIKNKKNFLYDSLKYLQLLKFINIYDINKNVIYIIGDEKERIINKQIKSEIDNLADEYIKITNINYRYNNLYLYKINPNVLLYKIVDCNNLIDNYKWDIITDGNIKRINEIQKIYHLKDFEYENVELFLNDIVYKKIVIEDSTFVINRGIKNDKIVINELYMSDINDDKVKKISAYFDNVDINSEKIKRLYL